MAGGRLEGDGDVLLGGVAIDSRRALEGDLFVALTGEHADGHAFADDAVSRGAAAVMARAVADVAASVPVIRVDDTVAGLQALAGAVRERLAARFVAITGSSGKTITKELTAAVARTRFETIASAASFNNEIGVPLTILQAGERSEVVVSEVGSRGIGHIASLMPMLRPDVGVVLNVGPAHIGMFGSLENVAVAKGEIVEGLDAAGVAVLNADDPAVAAMAERTRARTVSFGTAAAADVRADDVRLSDTGAASFTLVSEGERADVTLRIPGEHLLSDALAAAAVGTVLGIPATEAAKALSEAAGPLWRMQVLDAPEGWRVVNDAYNANPASMAAGLKAAVWMARGGRCIAVLGWMAELGDSTDEEHERVGELVARLRVHHLVTVGERARRIAVGAVREGVEPERITEVRDAGEAASVVLGMAAQGDLVFLKGSRVAGLERVASLIVEESA